MVMGLVLGVVGIDWRQRCWSVCDVVYEVMIGGYQCLCVLFMVISRCEAIHKVCRSGS